MKVHFVGERRSSDVSKKKRWCHSSLLHQPLSSVTLPLLGVRTEGFSASFMPGLRRRVRVS